MPETKPEPTDASATDDISNALQMLMLLHEELAPDGQQVIPTAVSETLFSTLKAVESRLRHSVLVLARLKHDAPMWQSFYLQKQLERWL